jgi:hypothetical protein
VPEPADVHINGPAVGREVALPDLPDQVGAAEHRRRVRGEEGEQLEFLESQRDLGAVHPDPPLVVVKQQAGTLARGLARGARVIEGRVIENLERRGGACRAGQAPRCRYRVPDDSQRRPGTGDRHHSEQGALRTRLPDCTRLASGPAAGRLGAA